MMYGKMKPAMADKKMAPKKAKKTSKPMMKAKKKK